MNFVKYESGLKQCAVYLIRNPAGELYVGGTTNLYQRYCQYKNDLAVSQPLLHASIMKHGFDNHSFIVWKQSTPDDIKDHEQIWLDMLKPKLNLCLKSTGSHKGRKFSDEHKLKLSIAHKGKKKTAETRKKMSIASKGRKKSAEHKINLSIALKDYWSRRRKEKGKKSAPFSAEHKLNLSIAGKDRKKSAEHKINLSIAMKAYWARHKEKKVNDAI